MNKVTAAFNILPDGNIVVDGEHSPGVSIGSWGDVGIYCEKVDIGFYRVYGRGIAWPEGWKVTVRQDDNSMPTSWVSLSSGDGFVDIESFDYEDKSIPKDVEYMITARVSVDRDAS